MYRTINFFHQSFVQPRTSTFVSLFPTIRRFFTSKPFSPPAHLIEDAEKGNPKAQFLLGCFYSSSSLENSNSDTNQRHLENILKEGSFVLAEPSERKKEYWKWIKKERKRLMEERTEKRNKEGNEENQTLAAHWFLKAANQNHPTAQYFVGLLTQEGVGTTKSMEEAVKWYEKSASQKEVLALFELGSLYYDGLLVPKDDEKSLEYFSEAAEKGDEDGMFWKAVLLLEQERLPEALPILQKAAEKKQPLAQHYLATLHYTGQITLPDDMAKLLMEEAAQEDNVDALFFLGNSFFLGDKGFPVDYTKSFKSYERAATLGHLDSLCCLGVLYFHGKGTEQDYAKALKCYESAALLGNVNAIRNLADMFEKGVGVQKSDSLANYYRGLASSLEQTCDSS